VQLVIDLQFTGCVELVRPLIVAEIRDHAIDCGASASDVPSVRHRK
jgi:hypothetical protein